MRAHHWYHTTRPDAAAEPHPSLVVRVLAPPHEVLVAHVVRALVDHEAATLHPDGVAAVEVGVEVCAVVTALTTATLKVSVFVKCNLSRKARMSPQLFYFKLSL